MKSILLFISLSFLGTTLHAQKVQINTATEINKLGNINALPSYWDKTTVKQVSSYDTTGNNDDGFSGKYSFIRKNKDGSLVIFDDKEIVMEIPIKLTGTSPGVKMGGKLVQKLRKLRVKSLPKDMPQTVEVSISKMEVGSLFRVRDLEKGDYVITNTPEDTIVSVGMSRALKQAEQAGGKK